MKKEYTKEEIQKALEHLKEKRPEHATREQAISLLETMEKFGEVFANTAVKKIKDTAN